MTDYRIWPATNGPDTSGSDGQPINLGTEFSATATAWAIGIRWYRGTTSVNPDNLRLYRVDSGSTGTMLAEVTAPSASGTGWQETAISPVALVTDQRYKAVAHMPDHYTATGGYWTTGGPGQGGITNGILTAPDTFGANGGGQGSFAYGAVAFPTGTFNGGNYWVDIILTDVNPNTVIDLAGAGPSAAGVNGDLSTDRALSGAAVAVSSATGSASATRNLAGTASVASSAAGALTVDSLTAHSFTPGALSTPWTSRRLSTPWRPGRLTT